MKETRSKKNERDHKRFLIGTWLYSLALVLVVLIFVYAVWFAFVLVRDDGMLPAVHAGDVLMCSKLSVYLSKIRRGDVFAFQNDARESPYLGRVVALGGETVQIQDGRVYIDRIWLDESGYVTGKSEDMDAVTVEEGYVFVMPDNRDRLSPDGQTMLIPLSSMLGRAVIRVSPLSRIGVFA